MAGTKKDTMAGVFFWIYLSLGSTRRLKAIKDDQKGDERNRFEKSLKATKSD